MKVKKRKIEKFGNVFYIQSEADIEYLVLFLSHKGLRIDQISYILSIPEDKVREYLAKWYNFK